MPPKFVAKPQVFKSPDGKEFTSKAEWRDYMMATFYSYKNKVNEPSPLIKYPGDVGGQMFDIADCENSTLVIMDNCEQVQIDQVKNCRIFIGACASSIFIRNCENCTFYTCCRQLRLREVIGSTFYIYSMAEVHIEYSNTLKFAPFNGGYPDHASHLRQAQLDIAHNLWYDIFDHNDAAKTHVNWSLLPESEYEQPWYPAGDACEHAVPRNSANSVHRAAPEQQDGNMQSFSLQQMIADAQAIQAAASAASTSQSAIAASDIAVTLPPAAPESEAVAGQSTECVITASACAATAGAADSNDPKFLIAQYGNYKAGDDLTKFTTEQFFSILPNGNSMSLQDMPAVIAANSLRSVESVHMGASCGWAVFWVTDDISMTRCSAVFELVNNAWKLALVHRSGPQPIAA